VVVEGWGDKLISLRLMICSAVTTNTDFQYSSGTMSFKKDCLPLLCSVFLTQGMVYCSIVRCFCHFRVALAFCDYGAKIIFLSPLDISINIFAIFPYFVLWFKYFDNAPWRYSWPECLTHSTSFFQILWMSSDIPRVYR